MRERVAITGVGMVTALGLDAPTTFRELVAGTRGFRPVTLFDVLDARARIAAEVRGLDVASVAPAGADWSRTDVMAVLAAREALARARAAPGRLGICLGGTTGGMLETEQGLLSGPLDRVDPARAARLLSHPLDLTTERVAEALGGAARSATLCAACSSSALAIAQGAAWLSEGSVELVLAGGADGLCRLTFFGFDALGALDPEPCRPFDVARRGLGLGEGAGFLCLERESTARARGAPIVAWLDGAAAGAEAHHITHPEPSGARAAELIARALSTAELEPRDIDYVNAHGTGTEQNDAMEARALRTALGGELGRVLVSSSKGQLGHTLGAAGALEAAVTVLALEHGVVPPTAGLATPADTGLRHVLGRSVAATLRAAVSCSFGFGGTGAVLVFQHPRAVASRSAVGSAGPHVPKVVVTGLAAATPSGTVTTPSAARALLDAPAGPGGPAPSDPVAALEPDRSRRFDRGAAFVTSLTEGARAGAGLDGAGVGVIAGTAFGAVERSVRFVLRAAERGVRRANPAEFPHLVASAASGNASIYGGLTGPALGVSAGTAGPELALTVAVAALRVGQARAFVAGAAEGFDPIVAGVLGPLRRASDSIARTEGGGMLLVELEDEARARGARLYCRLHGPFSLRPGEPWPVPPPARDERALVLSSVLALEHGELLRRSAWSGARRCSTLAGSGHHEAAGAVALVAGAAAVARGDADEALVLNGVREVLWLTLFTRAGAEP